MTWEADLWIDFGGEASDLGDSSYKAYESDASYSDFFECDSDKVDEPEVELVGEMIQKELNHLLVSKFWGLGDYFDSNSNEDLNNDLDSDENGNEKYPLFNPQPDMRKPILIKGLVFPNKDIFKDAIRQYGRINRVVPGSPWTLLASKLSPKDPMDGSWQIKTLVNHHKCGKSLIKVISVLFPNVEARNCARHLYNNFKNMEGFRDNLNKQCLK
ncbi:hypothetical protein GOBAR_AA13797 [Gossypium barbadense]|uniref:Transposase MuDR plant domain-containing protein n=1 Tax=Gossypium barbadense TaxID=3634 RepID=A0A2P5XU19_GOSBA|nr:hypothetical protein GOBAR_AA13797 [Gossypium barbadense]